jgi:adenylate kinase family enzyme
LPKVDLVELVSPGFQQPAVARRNSRVRRYGGLGESFWRGERDGGPERIAAICAASATLSLMKDASVAIGRRVLVIGMAGSGKSTFSRALSAKTGLPVIHLDLHYWKPRWVRPSEDDWREKQRCLLASEDWIADGNYYETLDLQLERAETVVFLDTPWWICAGRAFGRGLRKPVGEMPEGCEDSLRRRLRDEWWLVGRIWRERRSEPERARVMVSEHGSHATLHVLRSKREAQEFLTGLSGE